MLQDSTVKQFDPKEFAVRIIIPILIVIASISTLLGWMFDSYLLTSLVKDHVPTMPWTAVTTLLLAGVMITTNNIQRWLGYGVLLNIVLAVTYCILAQLGVFFKAPEHAASVLYMMPSLETVLLAFISWLCIGCIDCSRYGGGLILILSIKSAIGHMIGIPLMYSYIEGYSTGVAVPTSIIFFMIGLWMIKGFYNDPRFDLNLIKDMFVHGKHYCIQ